MTRFIEKLKERLTFRKRASFKSMIKGHKNYDNINEIIDYINSLTDEKVKAKLVKQLKQYFATEFEMQPDKILLASEASRLKHGCELCAVIGDITVDENLLAEVGTGISNIKYVVGNLNVTADEVDLKYLFRVYGDLKIAKQTRFSSTALTEVKGSLLMPGNENTSVINVVYIGKRGDFSNSKVKYLIRLESCGLSLNLNGSDVEYLASLKYGGSEFIDFRNTHISKINKNWTHDFSTTVYTTPHNWTSEN